MEIILILFIAVVVFGVKLATSHQRYSEPGTSTDIRNIEEYGEPVRSLYTSTDVFTLHHRIEITDDSGDVVYRSETQFPSIHDKTDIYTVDNQHIAHIERKLVTLHEVRFIDMIDGKSFALSNELFHIVRDVTNIEGLGWILEGNFLQLNFTIRDADGKLIALIHQKMFSVHDKYAADIYMPEYEAEVVAILIALQHMIRDRENASAASSGA